MSLIHDSKRTPVIEVLVSVNIYRYILDWNFKSLLFLLNLFTPSVKGIYLTRTRAAFDLIKNGSDWCYVEISLDVNTGSGNGLLSDGTKPLPEPMLKWLRIWNGDKFDQRKINVLWSPLRAIVIKRRGYFHWSTGESMVWSLPNWMFVFNPLEYP